MKPQFDILKKLLTSPIAFHKIFGQIGGGATEGLFLSQAYYWSQHTKDPEGWFYKSVAEWQEETCLTRREQESARKKLINLGVLAEKRQDKGEVRRMLFRVDCDRLYELIWESVDPKVRSDVSQRSEVTLGNSDPKVRSDVSQRSDLTEPNVRSDVTYKETEITTETTKQRINPPIVPQAQKAGGEGKEISLVEIVSDPEPTKNNLTGQKAQILAKTESPLDRASVPPSENDNHYQPLAGKDPKTGKEYAPWQGLLTEKGKTRNAIAPDFLAFVAESLAGKYSMFKGMSVVELRRETTKYVARAQANPERLAEIEEYWRDFCDRDSLPKSSARELEAQAASQNVLQMLKRNKSC